MTRTGSLSGALPWPGTCTSGWYTKLLDYFNFIFLFSGPLLEFPPSARSTESVLTTAPPLPTGPAVTAVLPGRLCKLWRD